MRGRDGSIDLSTKLALVQHRWPYKISAPIICYLNVFYDLFCGLEASVFFVLATRCARQLGPSLMIYHNSGIKTVFKAPNIVSAQPTPTPLIMGKVAAVAPAPSIHLSRLLDAATVPALPTYKSSRSAAIQFKEAEAQNPTKNSMISGPAMCTRSCNIQPKAIVHAVVKTIVGTATSSLARSIGKLVKSVRRFFSTVISRRFAWR
jgi:hypothetical protein